MSLGRGALAGLAALTLLGGCRRGGAEEGAELAISCGALGLELELCREGVQRWEQRSGHVVHIVSTPNSSTDRLALYLQVLASESTELDVLQIDVVWPGILASHLVDLGPYLGDAPSGMFPALVRNDTVDGRLVAVPWFTDAGVLYYRSDLLAAYGFQPPQTWAELTQQAKTILAGERAGGRTGLWGFVWQGKPYEGLTCDALEWIASFGGGQILAGDGAVTVDSPRAVDALRMAQGWVGTISPPGVLSYDEEASRGVFQTGNAVFMRNWPYAWALAQSADSPVRGKVGVVALPRGTDGEHAGTLGGWQLAVSRYSKHPSLAADLVRFLTSPEEQKRRAIAGAYNPTVLSLYRDPQVLEANPFFGKLFASFENAVARPSGVVGPQYNRVSNAFWSAVHDVLEGAEPSQRLDALALDLKRLRARARW